CAPPPPAAFKLLEGSTRPRLQGAVYLVGNVLGLALAVYKCQAMGLLPTHASDWLAFIEPQQSLEFSGGGILL
ncbi:ER membrane protein complex subunit 4, partial [Petromyzon marinus]|uniref:ER membrane protein complex subunit 4 n=1 Tax=Petromyzon marinus TaxID=7757 RepID=UPI003F6F8C96